MFSFECRTVTGLSFEHGRAWCLKTQSQLWDLQMKRNQLWDARPSDIPAMAACTGGNGNNLDAQESNQISFKHLLLVAGIICGHPGFLWANGTNQPSADDKRTWPLKLQCILGGHTSPAQQFFRMTEALSASSFPGKLQNLVRKSPRPTKCRCIQGV